MPSKFHRKWARWPSSQAPNSGIGYWTVAELARHGADVVLACRSASKAEKAIKSIRKEIANDPEHGEVTFMLMDVSSLSSVESFCDEFAKTHSALDLLVNNAGVMAIPFAESEDGYDVQFTSNHLGHFALTTRLFPLLKKSSAARVVNVSSGAHHFAQMDMSNIMMGKEGYNTFVAYANTKLYNILFSIELDRRLKESGITSITSVCAHPGYVRTNLLAASANEKGWLGWIQWKLYLAKPDFQSAYMGSLPQLFAASGPNVEGGDYFGPENGKNGYPASESPANESNSEEAGKAMWEQSEHLAKLEFKVE